MKYDLSILIPARSEAFLRHTVEDILKHSGERTEIIAVLDGSLPLEPIPDHPRLTLVFLSESIGQRAATNLAARLSDARYLMKTDAHTAFSPGFDEKMIEAFSELGDDVTMVPTMRNLHVFDWVCEDGHRRYQGPSGVCVTCGKETKQEVVWKAKHSPQSTSYLFTPEPKFGYFKEFAKRPEAQGELTETMSLQGSCFMLTRERYWSLNICDESWGSWGSQGIEVAVKSWLSGGRVVVNQRCWYAHLFRTQGGNFSFPYPLSGRQVDHAKKTARELFFENKWPHAIRPLSWLIEKFSPVPGWSAEDLAALKAKEKAINRPVSKQILYYTCNTHRPEIDEQCREQLLKAKLPIVSVSLNRELEFGDVRIVMEGQRSPLTMHRQILEGLKRCTAEFVYLCESDVLYHPCHFDFTPPTKDAFYFNTNVWKIDYFTGKAVWTDDLQQLSGMVAARELLLEFFSRRVAQIEQEGFNKHYEPSNKQSIKVGSSINFRSALPNVCIRHDGNITKSKWSPEEFRNKQYAKGWTEAESVPGWGTFKGVTENG
jgi:glycosyltransferase involved in cell wall biosynthesis